MENPTFHLEGVIRTREEMQDFEGPLTLILMLLAKNKIEIRDIKIADIQYGLRVRVQHQRHALRAHRFPGGEQYGLHSAFQIYLIHNPCSPKWPRYRRR